jgi:hypothetical protein
MQLRDARDSHDPQLLRPQPANALCAGVAFYAAAILRSKFAIVLGSARFQDDEIDASERWS